MAEVHIQLNGSMCVGGSVLAVVRLEVEVEKIPVCP